MKKRFEIEWDYKDKKQWGEGFCPTIKGIEELIRKHLPAYIDKFKVIELPKEETKTTNDITFKFLSNKEEDVYSEKDGEPIEHGHTILEDIEDCPICRNDKCKICGAFIGKRGEHICTTSDSLKSKPIEKIKIKLIRRDFE